MTPAYADVYVKVDAQGNAISQAIVCEYNVCGDPNSDFNKHNTNEGERWVLQSGDGAQAGFGKSNNPNEQIKVDVQTNTWTSTINEQTRVIPLKPEPVLVSPPTQLETTTVVVDTATAIIDTATALSDIDFSSSDWFTEFIAWFNNIMNQFYAIIEGLKK
jgi:hypothetical protein